MLEVHSDKKYVSHYINGLHAVHAAVILKSCL